MKKLLFKIKDNNLIIKERIKLSTEHKNILNTNVISCNELIFSTDYILTNNKILSTFINELAKDYNLDTIIIEKMGFVPLILNIIKSNKEIINLVIKEDSQLTFSICELLIKTNIKNVSAYNLQPFMIEYLDKYQILVESRNEILFLSNFMLDNNLNIFSSLFYKMTLNINLPMNFQDEEDFQAFCRINKYLKTINVKSVQKNDLEFIIDTLRKNNKKNIKILIHDNIDDLEVIEYLKNYNKKKSKRYKIYFRLVYSNEYLKDNLLKETNNSILKYCGYIIILIITFSFGYMFYDNYTSMQSNLEIKNELQNIINLDDASIIVDNLNANKDENDKLVVNEDVASIFNINPETIGWLKVNNTNIDYPVLQTSNNTYYLNHNIYFEKDYNGWVFMDYRNNLDFLNDNLIIYAHNRYYNGVMFGTLQNTMRKSWYTNPDNQIITLRTLYEELHYKVFSIYKIESTTDYLEVLFPNDDVKLNMFNMLKNRSIYNFGVDLKKEDKILTLSTCADENNRIVVHGVLIK